MKFESSLTKGTLLKRYKRFLADVVLANGEKITAYVPNTGSLLTCIDKDMQAMVSYHPDKERKLPYTLEMVHMPKSWIGINTGIANNIVAEALEKKLIQNLPYPLKIEREVSILKSRFDFRLTSGKEEIYLEVKNTTYRSETQKDLAQFPDAVTTRGVKHLEDLIQLKKMGKRAIIFYLVQRQDVAQFSPAAHIDPLYAKTLAKAVDQGVEIMVYQTQISPKEILVSKELPWKLKI